MGNVLHRQLAAGVFACGAKAADGGRGTPRPANVTCGLCIRAVAAKQDRNKTSLRLLTEVRERLLAARSRPTPEERSEPHGITKGTR